MAIFKFLSLIQKIPPLKTRPSGNSLHRELPEGLVLELSGVGGKYYFLRFQR